MTKESKPIKFKVTVQCSKCKKDIKGDMVLDHGLTLIHTTGFMLFEDIECDHCCADFRDGFGNLIEEACNELGVTAEQIGIDLERRKH